MKVSYNWLTTYFKPGEAPTADAVPDLLNFHSFEVESSDKLENGDAVFDVKVLPNRAHDALSHWSIAWELATITGKKLDTSVFQKKIESFAGEKSADLLDLVVEDSALVPRAMKRVVLGVSVKESPEWLKERLAAIGQRSINSIVDATNFLTHELGQPVHAFDYDKLTGSGKKKIVIRHAKSEEQVTALDGKTYTLEPWMLVISDGETALDIAGIKGGNNSGIDEKTTRIVLSACTFDGPTIRKTSQKLGLRTDASARFEHGLSTHLPEVGMKRLSNLVTELAGGLVTEDILDVYPVPQKPHSITVTAQDVERMLGISISEKEIGDVLDRIGFSWKPGFVVEVPPTRLDLEDVPDMIEEIGRFYGYEHVKAVLPPALTRKPAVLKSYYYSEKIREILVAQGFSELYLYSLVGEGERELENPLSEYKNMMRVALAPGVSERLGFNFRNKDILGLDHVSLFEIGAVYPKAGERTHVVLASSNKKLKLAELLPWPVKNLYTGTENILEFSLTELVATLPEVANYSDLTSLDASEKIYTPFSPFPSSARDVAVFVPTDISADQVIARINEKKGPLCVLGPRIFDTFTKTFPDGTQKTSYGFRLVFQASDRTLTNEEVQAVMESIWADLNAQQDWQVR